MTMQWTAEQEGRRHNKGLASGGCSASYDSFVLRNPPLRKAAKRWRSCYEKKSNNKLTLYSEQRKGKLTTKKSKHKRKFKIMRHFNLTILITILAPNFALVSCNQTSKSDDKQKALTEKEYELLKKEYELLKKELELNQKTIKSTTGNSIVKQSENSTSNNLDFLKRLNGKYPYEVKLLDNSALTQRLKKLLCNRRYNFLKETWAVETPMEFANNIFVAFGCQAHNCGSTNFIIVYDFSKNVMYAGIREEDNVKTYSEDGSNSPKINEWENKY